MLTFALFSQAVSKPIRLRERSTPLKTVLRKIERQSTYLFLYNETRIDMEQRIHIELTADDIRQVLDQLCEVVAIRYEIMDEQILLLPNEPKAQADSLRLLSGYIRDEKGHPLEYATIYDERTRQGIVPDATGPVHL